MNIELIRGECLAEMDKLIERGVVVDAIITDPPYGTTACKWDSVIPFDAMWERLNKLIKPNGAVVLFGSEPFSSALRMSNIKNYKYDCYWKKSKPVNHINAKHQPMRKIETLSIFYKKIPTFNRIKKEVPITTTSTTKNTVFGKSKNNYTREVTHNANFDLLEFRGDTNKVHPTQKPVALMEYLIKTYTNEGETVLDFTMGSGTTGVACKNLNRYFIGIEMDDKYFEIANEIIGATE